MAENRERKILIVTKDESVRNLVKNIEDELQYDKFILVESVKEFFNELLEDDIDLIVYDPEIKSLNGIDAFSVAKSYHPKIPAIIIFENEDFETTRTIIEKGVVYRMIKPINKQDLEQVCENVRMSKLYQSNKDYLEFE